MLREIICDKFKEKKIEFHDGLNVVLGDEQGSNSIGKSTFLMIIDYVYGGKDYVMKSIDIQRNVGAHIIKFSFVFKGNKYYFSRNTNDTEYVNICNDKYEVTEMITLEQYTNKLKSLYEFGDKDMSNLSQVILFKFAELQKKIEILSNQNKYYDELQVLSKEKKDADSRKQMMRMQQLSQLQNSINIKLQQLNDEIYHATKRPPIIMFDDKQYKFETIDDTGTGTCYRGMVLFDLAVLQDTCLPILVHDSVLLKQIEDVAIEKILDMYTDSEKQIFISLDKATSYSKKSQQILFDKKVLCLGPNGRELFGQSWSRK